MNTSANQPTESRLKQQITGLVKLTRWQEHILFTIPVTLLGVNMALWHSAAQFSVGSTSAIMLANMLAVTFAFMINDLADAADDARDPLRAARNSVTMGHITPRLGWMATGVIGLIALGLFATINQATLLIGAATLTLSFLYSWRGIRLKAWPVVDVVSHLLMLSSLLFLAGYFVFDHTPGLVWWIAGGVGLISAYGQLYNQLRDFALDQAAGLKNTTHFLGPRYTQWAMYGCLVLAALSLGFTVLQGLWPWWLLLLPLGLIPLMFAFKTARDMRGSAAIDITGQAQWGAMLIATIMMVVWLVVIIAQSG